MSKPIVPRGHRLTNAIRDANRNPGLIFKKRRGAGKEISAFNTLNSPRKKKRPITLPALPVSIIPIDGDNHE